MVAAVEMVRRNNGVYAVDEVPADRVEAIRRLWERADELSDQFDAKRWELARLIYEEIEENSKTTRQLGDEIGRSHTHVSRMRRAWEIAQAHPELPEGPFNDVYKLLKRGNGLETRVPRGAASIKLKRLQSDMVSFLPSLYGTDEKVLDSLRRLEWAARDLAERIQEYLGEE